MKLKDAQNERPGKSQIKTNRNRGQRRWRSLAPLLAAAWLCAAGTLRAQVISLVLSNDVTLKTPVFLTTDGTNLIVSGAGTDNNAHIFQVAVAGGAATMLYPAYNPSQVAIAGTNLFWIDPNSGPVTDTQILKAPASGGGAVSAIYTGSNVGQPILDGSGLASDGNFIYSADEVAGTVWRLNTDGSALTQVGPARYGGGFSPEHLNTIAVSQGVLYVADHGSSGFSIAPAVVSIPTNGTFFTTLSSGAPMVTPSGIAAGNGVLYVADPGAGNTVWQLPIGGGTPVALVSGGVFKQIQGLCYLNGSLYVSDTTAGAIYRVNLTQPVFQAATYLAAAGADLSGTGIKCFGGAAYVCGNSTSAGGLLARFNLPFTGGAAPGWSAYWPVSSPNDSFAGITASSSGVYASGSDYSRTTDTVGGKENKGLVAKFPFTGLTGGGYAGSIWDRQTPAAPGAFSYGGSEALHGLSLATENGTNYIYTTGSGQHDGGNGGRLFISKLAEDSTVLWTQTDGAEMVGEAYTYGNATAAFNTNVYVAGMFTSTSFPQQTYLRKYGSTGALQWVRTGNFAGGYNSLVNIGKAIYAVGWIGTNSGAGASIDMLIEKWDEQGNLIWSRSYDRNGAEDNLNGAVNLGGRLFVAGYTRGQTAGGADSALMEVDPATGNLLSTALFGGTHDDMATGVDTDGTDLYVVGQSRSVGNNSNQVMVLRYTLQPSLVNFTITPVNPVIGAGTNLQFIATGHFSDGSSQLVTNGITWASSGPITASITTNGLASGLSLGTSTVSATSGSASGSTLLTVVVHPTISVNPSNTTATPGGIVVLSAGASGGNLGYQWQLNGTNIAGATGASLSLTNVNAGQAGSYTVIVSNAAGSSTSTGAVLSLLSLNMYAGLTIVGQAGGTYQIDYKNNLSATNWTSLTNIVLPASPYLFIDTTSPSSASRFYRASKQ
jgi:hypothetical protein